MNFREKSSDRNESSELKSSNRDFEGSESQDSSKGFVLKRVSFLPLHDF